MEGTVQQIRSQPRGNRGSLAYSVKMDDNQWYGHGFQQPVFGEGAYISFEVTYRGQYANIDPASVQVLQPGQPPQAQNQQPPQNQGGYGRQHGGGAPRSGGYNRNGGASSGGGRGNSGVGRDQYWENKEKRDVRVQRQIQYQSSRNSAIELIKVAVAADALALPSKKADKFDALVALTNELTDQFNEQTVAVGRGENPNAQPEQPDDPHGFDDDIPFGG